MSDNPYVHGHGESYRSIVPSKSRNKGGRPLADGVEGREWTKENIVESNPCRTQHRLSSRACPAPPGSPTWRARLESPLTGILPNL